MTKLEELKAAYGAAADAAANAAWYATDAADAADAARTATWAAGDACAAEYAAQTEMLNKILRKWERTPPAEDKNDD